MCVGMATAPRVRVLVTLVHLAPAALSRPLMDNKSTLEPQLGAMAADALRASLKDGWERPNSKYMAESSSLSAPLPIFPPLEKECE